jgi:hypothetical protein
MLAPRAFPNYDKSNMEWHHIVEQKQIELSNFDAKLIHNMNNMVLLTSEQHREITAYYNTKSDEYDGKSPREYLKGKYFQFQLQFGIEALEFVLDINVVNNY